MSRRRWRCKGIFLLAWQVFRISNRTHSNSGSAIYDFELLQSARCKSPSLLHLRIVERCINYGGCMLRGCNNFSKLTYGSISDHATLGWDWAGSFCYVNIPVQPLSSGPMQHSQRIRLEQGNTRRQISGCPLHALARVTANVADPAMQSCTRDILDVTIYSGHKLLTVVILNAPGNTNN